MLMRQAAASLNHSVSPALSWCSLKLAGLFWAFRKKLNCWNCVTNMFWGLGSVCCLNILFEMDACPVQTFHSSGGAPELLLFSINKSYQSQADVTCKELLWLTLVLSLAHTCPISWYKHHHICSGASKKQLFCSEWYQVWGRDRPPLLLLKAIRNVPIWNCRTVPSTVCLSALPIRWCLLVSSFWLFV